MRAPFFAASSILANTIARSSPSMIGLPACGAVLKRVRRKAPLDAYRCSVSASEVRQDRRFRSGVAVRPQRAVIYFRYGLL